MRRGRSDPGTGVGPLDPVLPGSGSDGVDAGAVEAQQHRLVSLIRLASTVPQAAMTASTRQEVNDAVCEAVVSVGLFETAWIGPADTRGAVPTVRTWASSEPIDIEPLRAGEVGSEPHPASRALETGEIVVWKVQKQGDPPAWAETALDQGYRACCAVPLGYREQDHGVLTLYASTPAAVSDPTPRVLSALIGPSVGHALSALSRTQGVLAANPTELTLRFDDESLVPLALARACECDLRLKGVVPAPEEVIELFYTVEGGSLAAVTAAGRELAAVETAATVGNGELKLTQDRCFASLLAEQGCQLRTLTADDTGGRAEVGVPVPVDNSRALATITARYPETELIAKYDDATDRRATEKPFEQALTDRQQEILRTAYEAGYIAQPRQVDGEEIAAQLDISQPTFNQNFWTALERYLDDALNE